MTRTHQIPITEYFFSQSYVVFSYKTFTIFYHRQEVLAAIRRVCCFWITQHEFNGVINVVSC